MRKKMKLLAAITAAAVVSTMSISAFGLNYTTETYYDVTNSNVSVKTNVTLDAGDVNAEVAYLVHAANDTTPTSADILYIDQKTGNGTTSMDFEWTTTTAKLDELATAGKTVYAYVGTTNTATPANQKDSNKVQLETYEVNYNITGKGTVVPASEIDTAELETETSASTTTTDYAVFYVFPEPGYTFSGVTETDEDSVTDVKGSTPFQEGVGQTISFVGDTTITFTFTETTGTGAATVTNAYKTVKAGEISGQAKAEGDVKEAGILVAWDDTAKSTLSSWVSNESLTAVDVASDKIFAYKAYQIAKDGTYIVTISDTSGITSDIATNAVVYAYTKGGDGKYKVVECSTKSN